MKWNKYHAKKTAVDDMVFDSKAEALMRPKLSSNVSTRQSMNSLSLLSSIRLSSTTTSTPLRLKHSP